MTSIRALFAVIALAGLLMLPALSLRAQEIPNPFPAGDVQVKPLPNGLRLIVREDHSLPIVAMVVVVRGGSGVDPRARGAAHYLEHITLQGTKHFPGSLAPQYALERVGGVSNAVTTRDCIRFQATVNSAHAELLVNALSDIVLVPTLSDDAFERERPLILAEIQRAQDNPISQLVDQAFNLTFHDHPYRDPSTGSISQVLAMTSADVHGYFQRWFVPANMSVVLVGDISPAKATELVTAAFGAAKNVPPPARPALETAPTTPANRHVARELDGTYQMMAFRSPAAGDFTGVVALDVLMTMLADGTDSLLPAWWARDRLPVDQFGIEFISSHDPGRFLIWMESDPNVAPRLRDSTLGLLNQLAKGPISAEALALAKQRLAGQYLLENETYSQQASTLAFYDGLGDARLSCRYLPTIQSITAERIRQAVPTSLLGWVTLGERPGGTP